LPSLPGSVREYSNLAAGVAGLVVESISGEGLAEYSRDNIFRPLGMNNTGWLLSNFNLNDIAVPYEIEQCIPYTSICADWTSPKSNFVISKLFDPPLAYKHYQMHPHYGNPQYPDGGVRTSVKDLSKFVLAMFGIEEGDATFSQGLIKEMLAKQLPAEIDARQRFFWRDDKEGHTGHRGSDIGVFTYLYFDPEEKTAVIILMNRGVDMAAERAMDKLSKRLWSM
jgi:CubicO group peptidase (beta-lactamase class C family)